MNKQFLKTRFTVPVLTAMVMAACNGGGDLAGIGGSGFISTGTVTGFGSVYVNGVKFEIDQASFEVEGRLNALESDLRVGMVVQVQGSVNDDGSTGTASFIRYADDLQGPVSAIDASDPDFKRLTVLEQTVVISAADTSYDGVNYDTIAIDQMIEISGFYDQNGDLQASYIERKDANDDIEIRGVIESLNPAVFTFDVRGVAVDASSARIEGFVSGELEEGVYVEVEGSFDSNTNTLNADEVEAEDDLYDDADEVEIEGYITDYTDNNHFEVNGIPVDASNIASTLQLSAGIKIEVEGYINNGDLIAEEIELRGGNAEVSAAVYSVDVTNNRFTLEVVSGQLVTVQVSSLTRMEDDAGSDDNLLLSELQAGNFVDVLGFEDGVNTITATRVKREAEIKDTELQGVVTAASNNSVTVLGVSFSIDGDTEFEENDVSLGISAFLDALTVDETVISIEDKAENGGPDGIADSVEIED